MTGRPSPRPTAQRAWPRLTTASPALRLPYQRQRAQFLAALHLAVIVLALVVLVFQAAATPGVIPPQPAELGAVLLLLAASYTFSRTRLYLLAAALDFGLGLIALLAPVMAISLVYTHGVFHLLALGYLGGMIAVSQKTAAHAKSDLAQEPAAGNTNEPMQKVWQASQSLLQSTLDAVPSHLAILDADGTIIAVNAAWREFADKNGFIAPDYGVGTNYLDICEASYLNGLEGAFQVRAK